MKKEILIYFIVTFLLTSCGEIANSEIDPKIYPTQAVNSIATPLVSATNTAAPTKTPTIIPTKTPPPTLVSMDEFMNGVSIPAYFKHEFSRPITAWVLENDIKPAGINWVSVHFFCYQNFNISFEIICGKDNLTTKRDIKNVVKKSHELGFRVFLEIATDFRGMPNQWSGDIGANFNEDDWQAWFDSYESYITNYATLAEEMNVDLFSIGQELNGTNHRELEWRKVAAAVREVYSGPILFSVDDSGFGVKWWDAVDYIGIHPYDIPLTNKTNPTVEEMVTYLKPTFDKLEALSEEYDRPVIFTEFGIFSVDGISKGMGVLWNPNYELQVDYQEQADVLQAYFESIQDKDWFNGTFLFYSDVVGNATNIDLSFFGKPAENVMRSFYGAPLKPDPTSIPSLSINDFEQHKIFENRFLNQWAVQPPDGNNSKIDIGEHDISKDGKDIMLTLSSFGQLWITFPMDVDITDYQWLTFDLYSPQVEVWNSSLGKNAPVAINILFYGTYSNSTPYSASISQSSPFIDGGNLLAGSWQKVIIPIDAFGPVIVEPVTELIFRNLSPNRYRFYLDNIQLLKEK